MPIRCGRHIQATRQFERGVDDTGGGAVVVLASQAGAQHAIDDVVEQVLRRVTDGVESQHHTDRGGGFDRAVDLGQDERHIVGRDRYVTGHVVEFVRLSHHGAVLQQGVGTPQDGVGGNNRIDAGGFGFDHAGVLGQDDGRLGGRDGDITGDIDLKAIDQAVDLAAHIVAHDQAAKCRCAIIGQCGLVQQGTCSHSGCSGNIDQTVEVNGQPPTGVVEVFGGQVKGGRGAFENIGGVGRTQDFAPEFGVAEVGLVQTRGLKVLFADVLVQVTGLAAAQVGLEQDTLASREGLRPIKRGVSGAAHTHAVARNDPLGTRHVGVGHTKQVDKGAHGQGQLVFFARNGRQVHRGDNAGIVTGSYGQTASACGQHAHGQCITVGDAGQSAAADQVAGQHEARRHALLWTSSTGCAACRGGVVFCRCCQHSGHCVLDVRKDLGLIAGLDSDGPGRLDVGVVQVGLDHGGIFVADLAAHQGIDGREQHVLRFPTDGVESQGDANRGAVRTDRAVVAGVDAGGVAALDAHITFGGGDLAVRNVSGRLVEDQVGGNRPAHGQALA